MPVTAKLSRSFYEKLGDEIANEFVEWFNQVDATYRGDLRELNEANYARFEAKLEQRIAELRAEMRQEITLLRAEMREGFGRMETQMQTLRADLFKWMFGAWVTLLAAMIALLKTP